MVNVSFICEDDAGKKIIESERFKIFLLSNDLNLIPPIYNAKGKGNLTEDNVSGLVNLALQNGATHVFLIVDMDLDGCVTITKQNLIKHPNTTIIVCRKAVEAWFLADSIAMSGLLRKKVNYQDPENPSLPYEIINNLHKEAFDGRGISKAILPNKLITLGFSMENAANHPNCQSARYFLEKLISLS